jgi:hypothetical protein
MNKTTTTNPVATNRVATNQGTTSQGTPAPNTTPRSLPRPQLKEVNNLTGLPCFQFMDMGAGRKFFDVVVVKASFELQNGVAQLSQNQADVCFVDDMWGDALSGTNPEFASLKAVGDTVLFKPVTDIYVTGTVRSFQNKPQTSWHGVLCVRRGKEMLINKTLRFTGPRQWRHTSGNIWKLTTPVATTAVPLRYELAYGGHYLDLKANKTTNKTTEQATEQTQETFAANPAGSGYFGPTDSLFSLSRPNNASPLATHQRDQSYTAPQIDWPTDRINTNTDINFKTYQPAGWGPIARWWRPRVERQGSYDAAWQQDFEQNTHGFADYPKDFDYSYFNSAPADQMVKGALNGALQGDEFIELVGVFRDKEAVSLQLPNWIIQADLFNPEGQKGTWLKDNMRLDTIHVDLDSQQLHATWRLTLRHEQNISHCIISEVQ